jgi:hypothetical protein
MVVGYLPGPLGGVFPGAAEAISDVDAGRAACACGRAHPAPFRRRAR